jgi:hypothetical protein
MVFDATASDAELYDPTTGTWTLTGRMGTPRNGQAATLLPDGQVLALAGAMDTSRATLLASAELYTLGTGTWTATGSMRTPRYGPTATLLPDGLVLVAGGGSASAELYHPTTGSWTLTGGMTSPHSVGSATLLPDGEVLIAGGEDAAGTPLASAELYMATPH